MPILREHELDVISHSVEQTQRWGIRLGRLFKPGDVVCLVGDLGAGKTMFSSGIGRGWGATIPLTSPTFNLAHEHRREQDDQILYHIDCYRLRDVDEVESVGLEEILEDENGIVVIEWAERIKEVLPDDCLWIEIRILEETRRNFVFEGMGERCRILTEQFREMTFGV